MSEDSVRSLARLAIAAIDEHGWIQGQMRSCDGVCAVGALESIMASSIFDECELKRRFLRIIGQDPDRVASQDGAIMLWNDVTGRSEEEVVEVFTAISEGRGV